MPKRSPPPDTLATLRRLFGGLPGVVEGTSYGTPAWRVGRNLLARLHQDGESLVLATTFEDREFLVRSAPAVFHFTPHYRDYPLVLVRLAAVDPAQLRQVLEDGWRRQAPRRLVTARDAAAQPRSPTPTPPAAAPRRPAY